jgi:hypothetical protein
LPPGPVSIHKWPIRFFTDGHESDEFASILHHDQRFKMD